MLYTYEKIGENRVWVSLNDFRGDEYLSMGLRIIDTGDEDPAVVWNESFKRWMEQYLEDTGEPWLIWSRSDLTYNKVWTKER